MPFRHFVATRHPCSTICSIVKEQKIQVGAILAAELSFQLHLLQHNIQQNMQHVECNLQEHSC